MALDALPRWLTENPGFDPLDGDLLTESALERLRWSEAPREEMLATARAYQRMYRVEPDREGAMALMRLGFASAQEIARIPRASFVRSAGEQLSGGAEHAENAHRRATRIAEKTVHVWATVSANVASPSARALRVNPAAQTLADAFEPLPSYQELFGSLNYYACEECDSMLGAAAYLVDLLRIIDEYITQQNKAIPPEMCFEARRPDIAQIPLTCEKTNGLIPYLQIVDERLAVTAQAKLGVADEEALWQALATAHYPFALPFNLPLAEIRALLGSVGIGLTALYEAWNQPASQSAREALGLSRTQYALLTTSLVGSEAALAECYGVQAGALASLANVETFLAQTRLDVDALSELVSQDLTEAEVDEGISQTFFVNRGLAAQKLHLRVIETESEGKRLSTIENLMADSLDPLDRVNRFIRLAATLGWSYGELDWALHAICAGEPELNDGESLIVGLAELAGLAGRLRLGITETSSLLLQAKTYGSGEAPTEFDALFNATAQIGAAAPYHPQGDAYNPSYADELREWTVASTAEKDQTIASWLAGSLSISIDALRMLADDFFSSSLVKLDVPALSTLQRHAALMRALGLPADQYLILLSATELAKRASLDAAQMLALANAAAWLRQAPLNAYTLAYVLSETPSPYVNVPYQLTSVAPWLKSLHGQLQNTPTSLQEEQLFTQLAILFDSSVQTLEPAMALAAKCVKLPEGMEHWQDAFLTQSTDKDIQETVETLLGWAARWLVLARELGLASALLASIAAHPAVYGFSKERLSISLANIRDLAAFQGFSASFQDTSGGLIAYAQALAGGQSPAAQAELIAKVTGWNVNQVQKLLGSVAGSPNAVSAFGALKRCFELTGRLGCDVAFAGSIAGLAGLEESQWGAYRSASEAVRNQIASLYDTSEWATNSARLQGQIDAAKRDALLALVLWKLSAKYGDVRSERNVYEYMLIDVETGPAVEISYIVEATNAAQLYLQRCRLRLEQGVEKLPIPEVWWSWIMNFRVWQANREVFLYPENYLLPSVRRSKTTLFEELETELQQSQVTEDYVADAYASYFAGFHEVAKLKPVDCYHTTVNGPNGAIDTLFLFARTETSPPTFYYCSRQNETTWTQWLKVGVSIDSELLTPTYAFNRLFVFWAELKRSTNSTIVPIGSSAESANSEVFKLSLNYSFLDHGGKWVPPQALTSDQIVNYVRPGGKMFPGVGPFTSLLDMSDPSWQRVYVLKTAAGNLCYAAGTPADYEKISVFCGPVLLALGSTSYEPGPGEQGLDPDETAFIEAIYKRTVDLDSLILAQRQGYLPLAAPVNLDVNLQDNFLVAGNEFLILSSAHNSSPNPTYRAGVDSVADAVQIVPSAEVFYDNCFGDLDQGYVRSEPAASLSVESLEAAGLEAAVAAKVLPLLQSANPKLLDEESFVRRPFDSSTNIATALSSLPLTSVQLEQVRSAMFASLGTFVPFQGISPVNGHVITVKNQPGWFQFDNGDESFLLTLSPTPQPGPGNVALPPFQTLESAASLHRPTLSPASFAIAEVGAKRGEAVYTYLCQYSLIDKNGNAVYDRAFEVFALDSLAEVLANVAPKLSGAQVKAIGNVLLNSPFAVADSFICSGINKATAEKIAAQLEGNGVIDVTGRVTMTLLTGEFIAKALTNMVLNKEITEAQVPLIYQMLVALTAPVELAYRNEGVPQPHSIWDYTFDVTRTSTGAVDQLSRRLFARGVPGLLELEAQQIPVVPVLPFERFSPDEYNLNWPAAIDGAQVDFQGVYGTYFWEVFFHVPILVATSLSSNQQFAAAERWFRYVLDPTVPEQFVLAPMFTQPSPETISPAQAQTIYGELQHTKVGEPPGFAILDEQGRVNKQFGATTDLSFLLGSATSAAAQSIVRNVLLNHQVASDADHYWQFQPFRNAKPESLHEMLSDEAAIEAYEDHPFDPHAIAALRIGAYEKSVLMQYVQNLTAWADAQFSRESFESITQATMLYVYAYDLLGERPVDLGPPPAREAKTFAQIKAEYPKEIPPFLIELEHTLAPLRSTVPAVDEGGTPFNALNTYFCMPENEQLLRMWDTLEDRLYKIRNSMNIEGEVRQLPLFAPPLNPLELVKAAGSEGGFLPAAEDSATLPAYRFTVMLERARAVTAQVSDFGAKLLAAMEKQDAETLELLRSTQESQILAMMTAIKQDGIADLTETIAGLRANLQSAKSRVSHYQGLISTGLSDSENTNLEAMAASLAFNLLATGLRAAATIAYTVPQVGSPFAMTYGGVQIGSALTAASTVAEIGGDISNFIASRSLTMAGYERREQDWTLALAEAQYDVTSLEKQIAAAQARLEGAGRELAVNAAEISQNAQVYEYLKDKFTSKSLYQWMVSRIAAVYFQAYRLALELSQAAQGSYQFELGVQENFLAFNYWDSLRKGLMAGENLSFSLSQMEASYLSKNTRRLEIERTVSLAMWNPKALWELKRAGACAFKLTEELYDYDYPGHYNRQIKSVSLSIPAVIGPYENFKATLKQTCSVVATSAEEDVAGYLLGSVKTKPTSGLREDREPRQQVAISRGVDDSGVFELDFHDERYLPFEGTGAVSSWELQLPQSTNRFDLNAIGDVIVTVRYTAIDGGEPYAKEVKALLGSNPLPGACYLSLAQAYQSQWAAFMANHSEPEKQVLSFEVAPGALAYMKQATLATVYVKLQTAAVAIADGSKFLSASSKGFAEEFSFSGEVGQILKLAVPEDEFVGAWELTFDLKQMRENAGLAALLDAEKQYLDPAKLLNAELILSYEGSVF